MKLADAESGKEHGNSKKAGLERKKKGSLI